MTNFTASVNRPTDRIVVLEPGAKWPEQAFASVLHRDGVAVVKESPGEAPEHFFRRLARQFAHLTSNGVLIGTVLVACAGTAAGRPIEHSRLVAHIQSNARDLSHGTVVFVRGEEHQTQARA